MFGETQTINTEAKFKEFFKDLNWRLSPVAEFKEFERRFKYGWSHLKLYQMFQDLCRRLI